MSPGNIDDVNAPKSSTNIVQEVTEYVIKHTADFHGRMPMSFGIYDEALHAVWPELYKTSPRAHLLVSISIYIDIAERWGFQVPPEIMEMRI